MTPESIRMRRQDNALTVIEAVRHLKAIFAAQGEAYARDVYQLDDWDMDGLRKRKAEDCKMRVERALDVLEKQNKVEAGAKPNAA